jgi:hypothetical protein
MNDLIQLIVVLAVLGLLGWLVGSYIPMPQPIRLILIVVIVLATIIYLLNYVGIVHMA